jgi:hypothetical protein
MAVLPRYSTTIAEIAPTSILLLSMAHPDPVWTFEWRLGSSSMLGGTGPYRELGAPMTIFAP